MHIFVRSNYLRDVPSLRSAGAEQVFAGEGEVALAMTEAVLRRLGATPDQIDRERARVRERALYVVSGFSRTYIFFIASLTLNGLNRSLFAFT